MYILVEPFCRDLMALHKTTHIVYYETTVSRAWNAVELELSACCDPNHRLLRYATDRSDLSSREQIWMHRLKPPHEPWEPTPHREPHGRSCSVRRGETKPSAAVQGGCSSPPEGRERCRSNSDEFEKLLFFSEQKTEEVLYATRKSLV